MLWMEDNNLGAAGGLPSDFVQRFQDPETWKVSLRMLDTLYLRESSLRNSANGIDATLLRDTIAPVLNASQANVSIDSGAATFLNRRARSDGVSLDSALDSHFRWLDSMLQSGLRIRSISLQSVLSKTVPGDRDWASYSVQDRISDVVEYASRLNARYSWIRVGIIDALPTHQQSWVTIYNSLRDSMNARRLTLDHIHLDMPVDFIGAGKSFQWADVHRIQRFVQTGIGAKFGLMLTSVEGGGNSNERWAQRTIAGLNDYQVAIRQLGNANLQPDRIIISSWYDFPNTSVPETMPEPTVAGVTAFKLRNTTQVVVQASNLLRGYDDFVGNGLQNELLQTFPIAAAASSSNTTAGRTPDNAVFGLGVVNAIDSLGQFQWQAAPGDSAPWIKATLPRQTGLGTIRLWPYQGRSSDEGGAIADVYVTNSSTRDPVSDPSAWKLVTSIDLRGQRDSYVEASMGFNQVKSVAVRFRDSVGTPGLAAMRIFATVPGNDLSYVSPLEPRIPHVDVSTEHVVSGQAGVKIASLAIGGQPAGLTYRLSVSDNRFEFRGNDLYLRNGVSVNRSTTTGIAVWVVLNDKSVLTKSFSKLVSFLVYDTPLPVANEDFGDAPSSFPVLTSQNGARHLASGPMFGATRTAEFDGHPSDRASNSTDDDGVQFLGLRGGTVDAQMVVNVSNVTRDTFVQAWIDFNGDGSWSGSDERIVSEYPVTNGRTIIPFSVPSEARLGTSFARIRLSTQSKLTPYGRAQDGEVEDYAVEINGPVASSGSFQSHLISNKTDGARMVQPLDFDRDGDVDLLTVAEFDNAVRLLINDGRQGFVEKWSGFASFATSALPLDIDQDGDIDILAAGYGNESLPGFGSEVVLFRNDGGFVFTRSVIATGLTGPYTVTAADMDRDGDLDPVVTATVGGAVKWIENLGDNRFVTRDVGTGRTPYFLSIADLDRDGDQDIVATEQGGDSIRLYVNNGSQVFSSQTIGSGFSGVLDAKIADFDGDGDLDVVVSHTLRNELVLLENQGQLTFVQKVLSNQAKLARQIEVADVDGDGLLDIIAGQTNENAVVWHKNMGRNQFDARYIVTDAQIVQQVSSVDMDGDGDLDILSASWLDDSIRWFEQTGVDRGDAPASFGEATHLISSLYLGRSVDADDAPQPSANADADDLDSDGDDDDGVSILSTLRTTYQPYTTSLHAKSSGAGFLDAWFDFDGNGRFDLSLEHLFGGRSVRLDRGSNYISFTVPAGITAGVATARFRVSSLGGLSSDGSASGGEVEDYRILIEPQIIFPKWCTSLPSDLVGTTEIVRTASGAKISLNGANLFEQSNQQDFGPLRVDGNDEGNLFTIVSNKSSEPLTINGGLGVDTVQYLEQNGTLDLSDNSSFVGISIERIETRDDKSQTIDLTKQNSKFFAETQSLEIVTDSKDFISFGLGWQINTPTMLNLEFAHRIRKDSDWVVLKNMEPWTNPVNQLDVNANGSIDPLDVLALVNFINSGSRLVTPTDDSELDNWFYLDADHSGAVDPLDVLSVVNAINSRAVQ